MNTNKAKAIELRLQGRSYKEISDELGVAESTLSGWFRHAQWSEEIKQKLEVRNREASRRRLQKIARQAKAEREKMYAQIRAEGSKSYQALKNESLFMAGLCLYWGEGDNKSYLRTRIANSNPQVLRIFYQFLQVYSPEVANKAKMELILYPDLDHLTCVKFWSKQVGISRDKFIKSSYIQGKHRRNRLAYGVGILYVNNRAHKELLFSWLEQLAQEWSGQT